MNIPLKYARKFKDCIGFSDGLAKVRFEDGTWGFIDRQGKNYTNVTFKNDMYDSFINGFSRVQLYEDKSGLQYLNKNLEAVFKPYNKAYPFVNGFARVMRDDGSMTFIDTDGNEMNISKKQLYNFSAEGFAVTQDFSGKYTYVDTKGYEHGQFDYAKSFSDDVAIVVTHHRNIIDWDGSRKSVPEYAIINKKFEIVGILEFDRYISVGDFYEGFAFCVYNEGNGMGGVFIDKKGNECNMGLTGLSLGSNFQNGLAFVSDYYSDGYYFINTDGKKVSKKYKLIRGLDNQFYDGMFLVGTMDNRRTYVDKTGKDIGKSFKYGRQFTNGFATVQLDNDKWSYIDTKGKLVFGEYFMTSGFYEDMGL
ncbi:MAG: WG repeat-containing protein, partial [Clostridia bacterium]|nr:WG repeat-containing protein [Clostridia bacterium]